MKQILSPPWPIRFALFDTEQENKFLIFGPCRRWRRQTRQKTVKFSVLQTQLAFFTSSWDSCIFVRANYFCFTVNPLSTKHVRSRRLNISLFGFFFFLWTSTLSRSTITQKEKSSANTAISTSRLDKNEYLFAFMHGRLSFSFSFLLQLFLKVNCLSLNIVLWLPLINFHFFLMNEST